MRLSSIIPLVVAFILAGFGAYFAASAAVEALEANSEEGVGFELRLQGYDWAEVEADGLQVVISGEAPTEATRFNVLTAASGIVDAARVIDNMSIFEAEPAAPPRFLVEMLRNDGDISLIGLIPASTDRQGIIGRLENAAEGARITDLMEAADYPAPPDWRASLDYAISALGDLPRAKVSVAAGRVDIKATAESEPARARLEADLSRRAPEAVVAALRITAPRPVITPFTLRFLIDGDGARFDSCASDTEDALSLILEAAVAAGLEGKSDCRLGLGAPSAAWGEAAVQGIAALSALGRGSLTIANLDMSLVAAAGTDPAIFNSVTSELDAALPAAFALTAVLPVPEVSTEAGPPAFRATLSPEGQVQMRGHVGDALAVSAVETYAKSRFGADKAFLTPEPHDDLPKGWSLRALAGLAALSEMERGSLEVGPDTLALRGETGDQDARTRMAQVLTEELGEGQAFSLNVVYQERLDPEANIPTPDECIASITAITDARKLTFEPGSAALDADSRDTITAIATVLKGCPEFEIVIEGHTDSQGREVMNLSLSQERAEAVVEALRAERVAWAGLYPRGFGETRPIAENDTETGREANRRIEFTLFAPEEAEEAAAPEAPEDVSDE